MYLQFSERLERVQERVSLLARLSPMMHWQKSASAPWRETICSCRLILHLLFNSLAAIVLKSKVPASHMSYLFFFDCDCLLQALNYVINTSWLSANHVIHNRRLDVQCSCWRKQRETKSSAFKMAKSVLLCLWICTVFQVVTYYFYF